MRPIPDAPVTYHSRAAPTLGEGTITPSVIYRFEHGCRSFFRDRDIADDQKIFKACMNIANTRARDWCMVNFRRFDGTDFDDFIRELRAFCLPYGWDHSIRSSIMDARQSPEQSFDDYVYGIERLNALLYSSTCRFPDDFLRILISAHVCDELSQEIVRKSIGGIKDYVEWKSAVSRADRERLRTAAEIRELVANHPALSGRRGPSPDAVVLANPRRRPPKITQAERQIIKNNNGCTKCRLLDVDHEAHSCPNGYPDGRNYVPLTTRFSHLVNKNVRPLRAIADGPRDEPSSNGPTLFIGSMTIGGDVPLAYTTGILGNGSDSGSDF